MLGEGMAPRKKTGSSTKIISLQDFNQATDHGVIAQECTNKGRTLLFDLDMTYYKVMVDDQVVDEGLSYREACELASEIDNDPRYYWKTVDIIPMKEEL